VTMTYGSDCMGIYQLGLVPAAFWFMNQTWVGVAWILFAFIYIWLY